MATSWLDLMGDDSNISMASMASMASITSLDGNNSRSKFDPEFDNSQQGMNLLFKKNVKFLPSDDSQQSRKRKFKEIGCLNEGKGDFLPPKAKQRTTAKGEWKKRKNDANATNFSRFLNPTFTPAPLCVNQNKTNTTKAKTIATQPIIEEEHKDIELEEEEEKAKPKQPQEYKKRRITPTLPNIVFNTLNEVPILKKKELNCDISDPANKAPMFLNLDQFKKLQSEKKEKEKEKEQEKEQEKEAEKKTSVSVWNDKERAEGEEEDKSWAKTLFAHQLKRNRQLKEKEEESLVKIKTQERIHEVRMENILPPAMSVSLKLSRESSISMSSSLSSPSSTTTIKTMTNIVIPSADAEEWRDKQIEMGKCTAGYKNYIKKYPNKDLRFRLNNNLMPTPESKEKIGKKRWVGKYKKWRKFLHKFDCDLESD